MQDLFLKYEWPILWRSVSNAKELYSEATIWRAILLANWWQEAVYAKQILAPLDKVLISKDYLSIFAHGLVALSNGDTLTLRCATNTLGKSKPQSWMTWWLKLEEAGRRRNFQLQAELLEIIAKCTKDAAWPYIACIQSLDQEHIDPAPLLKVLINYKEKSEWQKLLFARLLMANQQTNEAIEMLEIMAYSESHISPIAAYQLGHAYSNETRILESIKVWDVAAKSGFMDRPTIKRWLFQSLSNEKTRSEIPRRIDNAITVCKSANLSSAERIFAGFASFRLIYEWIECNYKNCYAIISANRIFLQNLNDDNKLNSDRNEEIFFNYVFKLCLHWQSNKNLYATDGNEWTLYVIGESHSMALANIVFECADKRWVARTKFVMGLKMWHLATEKNNIYKSAAFDYILGIPKRSDILICVGEIDSRPNEGIWRLKSKDVDVNIDEIILRTVSGYLNWLKNSLELCEPNSIIIQGVPAPGYPLIKKHDPGDVEGYLSMMHKLNNIMKHKTLEMGWSFLDVYSATVNKAGVANQQYHLDGFHLKPSFYEVADRWLCTSDLNA